jgi:uncharacterized cupredoxin-like copper-binding protein
MIIQRELQHASGRVAALAVVALLVASCGGDDGESATATSPAETVETSPAEPTMTTPAAPATDTAAPTAAAIEVTAKLTEFSIELSQDTFTPGTYEFVAEEEGASPHALSIEGPGVDSTSTEVIQPGGENQRLTVTLQTGTYTLWCPVGNHRGQGMETTITVE